MIRAMLFAIACALLAPLAHTAGADSPIGTCRDEQLSFVEPEDEEVRAHRQFAVPVINYPFDTRLEHWGVWLTLRVDEQGRVTCWSNQSDHFELVPIAQRQALLDAMQSWRYTPFLRDKLPTAVTVNEEIREQELPAATRRMPDAAPAGARITLERSSHEESPSYWVEMGGDGHAMYEGREFVDVVGRHEFTVPQGSMGQLLDYIRANDIWSLREEYAAEFTYGPVHELNIEVGGETRTIIDYFGERVGMPVAVTGLEQRIDAATGAGGWIALSQEAVGRLEAEGFAFDSTQGAELLARAVANEDGHDDRAMLRLIELGAPITGSVPTPGLARRPASLLEYALYHRREILVEPLIDRGALLSNGWLDQAKLDAAFRAAIMGGRLAPVQAIWDAGGEVARPALSFEDTGADGDRAAIVSPVSLLLSSREWERDPQWQALPIARWLATQGCALDARGADGDTLLHEAAAADDLALVRYLLEQGLDPSTPGMTGSPALASTWDEDIALLLLQAGTDLSRMQVSRAQFRDRAAASGWTRVVAWLATHEH